ncbi:MAG: High-affinity zinc uptake system binding-protein ZnuA precursor [Candidatus Izimaplasma bacterium HR2]|nr:MAG: High-affinity zinc uptake system binding-protein ZnuA precursor [Candidatus Izimaplasma bacterium HR2]
MKRMMLLITTILIVVTLSACHRSLCEGENCVYVTVYPMQYLVEQIGGDYVDVARVPGSQVHSESIDWSAKEIIDMKNADILFYINGGVDTYIPEKEESTFEDSNVKLVDISQVVTYNEVCFSHEHDHDGEEVEHVECDENSLSEDPHFWLDPVRMLIAAEFVKDQLILEFPVYETTFEENYEALKLNLEKLDEDYQAMADAATKPIITTVMLFTYWHVRYDIEILSITTSAHSTESSASDIIYFSEEAALHNIHYVLFEKNTNSPAGDGVLEELLKTDSTALAAYLHGLGNLTNEESDVNLNYLSIMYDNLDILIEATQ